MATLIIHKLDESIKQSLRIKAAHHGISMENISPMLLQKSLGKAKNRFASVDSSNYQKCVTKPK